ncbi:MAG TPA: hypothetical protein VK612_09600 [Pyrinomonadaceae bacterium]|nr:hypothetical protein [Pyrinomonadaceae bacterium]
MSSLTTAIDDLYKAFAEVARPEMIHACPCCMTAEEVETLLARPLRGLTSDELSSYASSALLTVGDVPDYLYFLPRILELSIQDDSWWPDIEVSGNKIKMTEPMSWSPKRLATLIIFFHASIDRILESANYHRIDEWMCAIGTTEVEIRPFLTRIEADSEAVLEYFGSNAKCLPDGKLCNPFWESSGDRHDEIVAWFTSGSVSKILFDAYGYKT